MTRRGGVSLSKEILAGSALVIIEVDSSNHFNTRIEDSEPSPR